MRKVNFTGTGLILRMFLHHDRWILAIWILLPVILINGQISFLGAAPDWRELIREMSASPFVTAWLGPIFPLSKAGAILWRGLLQAALAVIFGSAMTAIRHTRTEEQSGRSELILGKAVGKYAQLTATLLLCCLGSLLAGFLVSLLLIISSFAVTGSILSGLTLAASGFLFAGIAVLTAQFYENTGSAHGVIYAVVIGSFIPMVLNNVGGASTVWGWFVPHAWFRLTVPFGDNRFLPLVIFVLLSLIPILLAYRISSRRDLQAGLIRTKSGPTKADPGLKSPLSMAWRQYKKTIFIWVIGMIWIGGALGFITPNIAETISDMLVEMNAWMATMASLGNRESFMALSIYILGLLVGMSIYGIITVLRLKKEEKGHFAEIVLTKPVGRGKWMSSYLIIAFAGSVIILLALGIASGLGWGLIEGDMTLLTHTLIMSLSKIPSVWVIIGITALFYGWIPCLASILSWLVLAVFIIIEMLWEVGIVSWSAMQFTPFAYAHYSIPVNELSIFSLLTLVLLSAILTIAGMIGFKHRSIQA